MQYLPFDRRRWYNIVPPVTKTWMPALAASSMVADTVVAPSKPLAMTSAKSLLDVFVTLGPLQASQPVHCILPK